MSVLDAAAVVAALTAEPAQPEVERILRGGAGPPRIAAMNLGEAFDVLVRVKSWRRGKAEQALSWLIAGGLDVISTTDQIGLAAGELRSRAYHRVTCPVSLCDCVALTTAQLAGQQLATSDAPLAALARLEGVNVIALPDSSGRRP